METTDKTQKSNGFALLPLGLFLLLFIGTGMFLTSQNTKMAFYQLSATVAILPAIALAMLIGKDKFGEKLTVFLGGVGHVNIITMCIIYLLAGGFASVAKSIGGVEATVNMGLSVVPEAFVLPGLFLIASFVSTAMGTSMGTIAAIAPIGIGVADQTGMSGVMLMGAVLGGAMFGDNLSMISDTTIAATRTQGCAMSDKFRMNLYIALPAAIITTVLLVLFGETSTGATVGDWKFIQVLPYLVILILAVSGVNVFLVLFLGIILAGGVGMFIKPDYSFLTFGQDIYKGFAGMNEIMILSMMIGGLGELIRHQGGLQWILNGINAFAHKVGNKNRRRTGEFSIAGLVSLADVCTANNTVAIILSGHLAKEIADDSGVTPRRSASLLDIFSCIVQGLVPYAAQVLLAGSIAKLSPVNIAMGNWYCMILAGVSVLAIITGMPRGKASVE